MTDRGGRKPGLALVGTVTGPAEAGDWQERLRVKGIVSIVRGHRAAREGGAHPSFSGCDVYVPATALGHARKVLGLADEAAPERPFPWVWLIAIPAGILIVIVGITLVLA